MCVTHVVKIQSSLEIRNAVTVSYTILCFNLLLFWKMVFINTYNLFSHSHIILSCLNLDDTLCGF